MKLRWWLDTSHGDDFSVVPGARGTSGLPHQSDLPGAGTSANWTGDGTGETHTGTNRADTLDGAGGDDTIHGGKGDDTITGGAGADTLTGDAGNDTIHCGNGADVLVDGGAGDDTILMDALGGSIGTLAGGAGFDTFDASGAINGYAIADANISGIEHFIGSENEETTGGFRFDETYEGRGGNDTLHGNNGNDTLLGGEGNDWLLGDRGNDIIKGENGDDSMAGGLDDDAFDGGAGWDHVYYTNSAAAVTVNLKTGTATGEGTDTIKNVEAVVGSAFNDHLTGSTGDNYLSGLAGDDVLDGGKGNDWVWYNTTNSNVTVNLTTGAASGALGNDTLISIESIGSGGGNDTLTGSGASNSIFGYDGSDTINGMAGDDFLYGGNGLDTITGGAGTDVIYGGAAADTFLFSKTLGDTHYIQDMEFGDIVDFRPIDAIRGGADQAFIIVTQFNGAPGEATVVFDGANNRTIISMDVDGGASPAADFVVVLANGNWSGYGNIFW